MDEIGISAAITRQSPKMTLFHGVLSAPGGSHLVEVAIFAEVANARISVSFMLRLWPQLNHIVHFLLGVYITKPYPTNLYSPTGSTYRLSGTLMPIPAVV